MLQHDMPTGGQTHQGPQNKHMMLAPQCTGLKTNATLICRKTGYEINKNKKWGPEQERRGGFYMYASHQNSLEARRPRFRRLGSVLPQQHQSHSLHHHSKNTAAFSVTTSTTIAIPLLPALGTPCYYYYCCYYYSYCYCDCYIHCHCDCDCDCYFFSDWKHHNWQLLLLILR